VYKYADGNIFVGGWKDNQIDGKGMMTYGSDGKTDTGLWRLGVKDGVHVVHTKAGEKLKFIWNNGEITKKICVMKRNT
jgi:hypothetical protein